MKKSIRLWEFFGFAFTVLFGTLLHFLYDFSGEAIWAAPISGVNESTWEHMKLLFFPMFIFAVIQYFFFKENKRYWCIKRNGILLGLIMIPLLFYMYNGIIGKSPDFVNIGIFFISAAIAYIYETKAFQNLDNCHIAPRLSFAVIFIIALMFVVFTFATPKLAIFMDPITGAFGI